MHALLPRYECVKVKFVIASDLVFDAEELAACRQRVLLAILLVEMSMGRCALVIREQ